MPGFFIINPGTESVPDPSEKLALAHAKKFLADLKLKNVTYRRAKELDSVGVESVGGEIGGGRFAFEFKKGQKKTVIEIPGAPEENVRYLLPKEQNIWSFYRLYVDGDSWVWLYALDQAREALSGKGAP